MLLKKPTNILSIIFNRKEKSVFRIFLVAFKIYKRVGGRVRLCAYYIFGVQFKKN